MAIHWKVLFKSLRSGTTYSVNIYDSSYTGAAVELTGADNPFEVTEDESDNMFEPIRKQTGYINIVDTGNVNWAAIIPTNATARPVTVTVSSNVIWQGFLQPQTFEGELYGDPQVRRLPVCCALSVLDSFDISPTWAETADFGQVLGYIFSFIPTLTVGHFYIAGGSVNDWLEKRVDWANFRNDGDDDVPRAKYSAGQLLEEICKFWGWTARTFGVDYYFAAGESTLYPAFMVYDLQDLDSPWTRQPSYADWTNATLSGNIFASVDNQDLIMLGIHKAEVTAEIGKFDSVLALDMNKYEDWLDRNATSISHWAGGSSNDKHYFYRTERFSNVEEFDPGEGVMRWDMGNCYLEIDVDTAQQPYFAAGAMYEFYYYEGQTSDLHDIPFRPLLKVDHNNNYQYNTDFACARIKSKHSVNFDHGVIVIGGDTLVAGILSGRYYEYNGCCQMTCRLKVGDYYWNGGLWTTTPSTFVIDPCGGTQWNSGAGKIESNRQLDSSFESPYPNYNGWGIPVTSSISGFLTFEILDLTTYGGGFFVGTTPWCGFSTLDVKFLRETAYAPYKDKSSATYTSTTNDFVETKSVNTIFASDGGFAAGVGIIMNDDNSYCATVPITESGGSYDDHPEQYLVDRMATYGRRTRRKLILELNTNAITRITPGHQVIIDGDTFYPVSISRNYRDDKTMLILMETSL